ncbi:MAG: hypothetical protein V4534_06410 [Myxococcota bacterium]
MKSLFISLLLVALVASSVQAERRLSIGLAALSGVVAAGGLASFIFGVITLTNENSGDAYCDNSSNYTKLTIIGHFCSARTPSCANYICKSETSADFREAIYQHVQKQSGLMPTALGAGAFIGGVFGAVMFGYNAYTRR